MVKPLSAAVLAGLLCTFALNFDAYGQQRELRRITQTEATSDCIGDPRTPLCAVETFVACWGRHDITLCKRVLPKKIVISHFNGDPLNEEYYVESQKTLTERDMRPELRDAEWHRPGIVDIVLQRRWCSIEMDDCANSEFYGFYYSVKQVGQEWQIISWTSDLDSI